MIVLNSNQQQLIVNSLRKAAEGDREACKDLRGDDEASETIRAILTKQARLADELAMTLEDACEVFYTVDERTTSG